MIYHGDCLDILPMLDANSVDAVVTDPPYGLSFMGKEWDHGIPGVHFWQATNRVMKPGAHLLAFGGTRTFQKEEKYCEIAANRLPKDLFAYAANA